ncbi:MAG: hypothetical protein JW840_00140 [Candidatus Thermoplasmatota archaeon]|nr:hypothetical protein [Candidatus Thermoplasmatota archaeon]
MTHNPRRIIFSFLILLFIGQLPFFSTPAQETTPNDYYTTTEQPDLLIILSPQYAADNDISHAIHSYIIAVRSDLGWHAQILPIHDDQNDYRIIDELIETTHQDHPLKACIMVGEDLNTPLGGDSDYLEQPSTLPWSTLGGPTAYNTTEQGILCKPTIQHICISLLYPTASLPYEQKKSFLIFAFQKFATQRHTPSPQKIHVLESSDLSSTSRPLYQQLRTYTNMSYTEDATDSEITSSLSTPYAAYFVHGHSNPAGTDTNQQKHTGWFPVENIDRLQTPFFGADGCYVAGWWSDHHDNNQLDPSIDAAWYGSKIFTSASLQAMALGLLSQNGYSTPVGFLETALPELLCGKTLAEAMIGDRTIGDTIIVGDPTFHYYI